MIDVFKVKATDFWATYGMSLQTRSDIHCK